MNTYDSIKELIISARTETSLNRSGIFTVGELCEKTVGEVMRIKGIGDGNLENIRQCLYEVGHNLKNDSYIPRFPPNPWRFLNQEPVFKVLSKIFNKYRISEETGLHENTLAQLTIDQLQSIKKNMRIEQARKSK
jgi:hypothetical protein